MKMVRVASYRFIKENMIIGKIAKLQVPLFFTFDEEKVELIAEMLAEGLEYHYANIDLFQFPDDLDPWEEE
jgi:hypothetical protein|tara:strand:+ start:230 stop:442 length:213 start_codon:yes stop_codon:yes gene_type:complete